MIYCIVNPNRTREIWQYISIINTASMSYNWKNVYNYDICSVSTADGVQSSKELGSNLQSNVEFFYD